MTREHNNPRGTSQLCSPKITRQLPRDWYSHRDTEQAGSGRGAPKGVNGMILSTRQVPPSAAPSLGDADSHAREKSLRTAALASMRAPNRQQPESEPPSAAKCPPVRHHMERHTLAALGRSP